MNTQEQDEFTADIEQNPYKKSLNPDEKAWQQSVNRVKNTYVFKDENGNFYEGIDNLSQQAEQEHRTYNIGNSDYAQHKIQPWDIWKEYNLNPWDADIIKRTLRTKTGEDRINDYKKIIHVCQERIYQLENK